MESKRRAVPQTVRGLIQMPCGTKSEAACWSSLWGRSFTLMVFSRISMAQYQQSTKNSADPQIFPEMEERRRSRGSSRSRYESEVLRRQLPEAYGE